jgi:hypothetical protein
LTRSRIHAGIVSFMAVLAGACSPDGGTRASERGGYALWIYANGADVYIAGLGAPKAPERDRFYLKNGDATTLGQFLAGMQVGQSLQLAPTTYHKTAGAIDTYVALQNTGDQLFAASYTRNGVSTAIPLPTVGEVTSVFVKGADVHLAGTYGRFAPGETGPGYVPEVAYVFVNGVRSDLESQGVWPRVNKVLVSDAGDIFAVGASDPDMPFYARNGAVHRLEHPGYDGSAWDVFVQGDDVYVAGSYREANGDFRACYWKNGVRSDLPGGVMSEAKGIVLVGTDVWVVGWYGDYPTASRACSWKNGVRQAF